MVLLILPSSCKKYEDGPWISFETKTERATGNFQFELVRENGIDITEEYANQSVRMGGDGSLYWTLGYYPNSWETYGIEGEWRFKNNKMQIEMHFTINVEEEFKYIWDIKRLADKDIKLERYEEDKKIEWRMWKY